jgi:uncharacterized membrane protein YfcA
LTADPLLLGFIAAAFVAGGFVKGTLGAGLPLVVVPLLSLALPGHRAIGLVVIPVVFSNIWQTWETRVPVRELRRFAPLVAAQAVTTVLTVRATLALSEKMLALMIAVAVLIATGLMAWQPALKVSPRSEKCWGFAAGVLAGLMGGVSSLTGPVIISYLMALRLPREIFIGSISVIYLCATVPLYSAMFWHGRIGSTEVLLSALALLPLWCGLRIGRACRMRLGERGFRRLLLAVLTLLAVALIVKSI